MNKLRYIQNISQNLLRNMDSLEIFSNLLYSHMNSKYSLSSFLKLMPSAGSHPVHSSKIKFHYSEPEEISSSLLIPIIKYLTSPGISDTNLYEIPFISIHCTPPNFLLIFLYKVFFHFNHQLALLAIAF